MSAVPSPRELFDLGGTRAAILGGTGVLGGRFARCLAAAGAEVVVLGRSVERGNAVTENIVNSGGNAVFMPVDVSDRSTLEAAAASLNASGGLDILVNAPGVNNTTPFEEVTA